VVKRRVVNFKLSFELIDLETERLKLFLLISHDLQKIIKISLQIFLAKVTSNDGINVVVVLGSDLVVPVEVGDQSSR
jgi:hypothetical protein